MKYVPPYGVSDPEASYINGDPTIGRQGSIPPAAAFENPMREIVAVITKNNIVPSDADLMQMTKGIRSQFLNYCDDTGSVDNLSVALDPPLPAYTRGLVLRVRLRNTNTGPVRINAGAGNVPVRKMNGSDVNEGELPAGGLATMVYDGTVFQLTNFGGAGAAAPGTEIINNFYTTKIPYTVDTSPNANIIIAPFSPAITELSAGDMFAVKVANTNSGPTVIHVNNLPAIPLQPNGGGLMLQGDIARDDVVIFFYDGEQAHFQPNPEIGAAVTYTVGPGQQFPDMTAANNAILRKTIGARGHVTFQLSQGVHAPFSFAHPSGDRVTIRGVRLGTPPTWSQFAATGTNATRRSQDAISNLALLRSRFGTEIKIPASGGVGMTNSGPGRVYFRDLLIIGDRLADTAPGGALSSRQIGVRLEAGFQMLAEYVGVWGCGLGFTQPGGNLQANYCYAVGGTGVNGAGQGFMIYSGFCGALGCVSCGNESAGFVGDTGTTLYGWDSCALSNAVYGYSAWNGSGFVLWYNRATGNGRDLHATTVSAIVLINNRAYGTCAPAINQVGNVNSVVTLGQRL